MKFSSSYFLILANGKPTSVHHKEGCRVFTDGHGPYRQAPTPEGKRPCGYCGGGPEGADS